MSGAQTPEIVARSADGAVRVERLITSGTFSLDGGTWEVDNNVWLVGDDRDVLIVDPAHDPRAVADAVAGRRVVAIVLTHAHDDHIREALEVQRLVGGRTWLHPQDRELWDMVHATAPDRDLRDGLVLSVGGVELTVLHTPGHAPGAVCLYAPQLTAVQDGRPVEPATGALLSGDTLFAGGPGATGRSYSDFPTIVRSIRQRLLVRPESTLVLTGHGDTTTIGAEAPHVQEWIVRGH